MSEEHQSWSPKTCASLWLPTQTCLNGKGTQGVAAASGQGERGQSEDGVVQPKEKVVGNPREAHFIEPSTLFQGITGTALDFTTTSGGAT